MKEDKSQKRNKIIRTILIIIVAIIGLLYYSLRYGMLGEWINEDISKKPIIYLYPEEEQLVEVKLLKEQNITVSYPKYNNSWQVIAKPNGDLKDIKTNRNLYGLYYEAKNNESKINLEEGFCIKRENIVSFLEEKLSILGLNEREANEFIIYWLPRLEKNEYNYIRFASISEINKIMPLEVSPQPDTIIRVLMEFKGLNKEIKVKEQELSKVNRNGFVLVEWGGTELK
mgnify:FL=1